MSGDPLFTRDGDSILPGERCRGPWDPRACHGGPVAALLAHAAIGEQRGDVDWQLSRITIELVRPVPLTPLRLESVLSRPGRKVSIVESTLTRPDGAEVARSRALRIRRAGVALPSGATTPEPPSSAPGDGHEPPPLEMGDLPTFHRDAARFRFHDGDFLEPGRARVWISIDAWLFPDVPLEGALLAAACADFGNGVSQALDPAQTTFVNPDLTVHLVREPVGPWIGLAGVSHYSPDGTGLAECALSDAHGRVGVSAQSLILEAR